MFNCRNCSEVFQTEDDCAAHAHQTHLRSVNVTINDVTLSIPPRPDGTFVCSCPYHTDETVYQTVADLAHHLRFAVEWGSSETKPPVCLELLDVHYMPDKRAEQELPSAVGPQLVETQSLHSTGLAINLDYHLLICLACENAVLPRNITSHLRDAHKTRISTQTLAALFSTCKYFQVLHEKFPDIASRVPQIHGLSVRTGFCCTACDAVYGTPEVVVKHFRSQHPGVPREKTWPQQSVQRLNGHDNRYIKIDTIPLPPTIIDNLIAGVDRLVQSGTAAEKAPSNSDKRNISPWLRETRWYELLDGHTPSDLCARVAAPTLSEFPNLQSTILHFLDECIAQIDTSSPLTLQTLNSPVVPVTTNHPFKKLNDETMKKYSCPLVNMVAMLLRGPYAPLPPEVQQRVDVFRSSLREDDEAARSRALLDLLSRLWMAPWLPTKDQRISDPTIIYLALSTLGQSGQFQEPRNVTNTIARLEYCMRLTFLKLIHDAPSLPAGLLRYQPWFTEKVESPFNSLRTLQHLATSIAYQTQSLPRVWWDDRKTYLSMLYKGDKIHFDQIRSMLSALEDELVQLWENDVLLATSVSVQYDDLHDDLSNREPGYSFINDPRNTVFEERHRLARSILRDPHLHARFINPATAQWNVHELRLWLSQYAHFHLLLLLKSNLTGGSPGRITELTAMQLCNLVRYPLRNLVVFGRHVALLCTYMKTSANSGFDKLIPHSLDAFTSDLIVQDLAIARPFAQFAIRVCHSTSPDIHALFSNHVFVRHTRLFTTDDVTQELKRLSIAHIGIELGVNGWRHVSTAFRRVLCPRFTHLLDDDPENESVEALQSGHTRQTENRVYGISQDALAGASEDVLPLFLDASTDWQLQCSVVPGGVRLPYADARMSRFDELIRAGIITPPTPLKRSWEEVLDAKLDNILQVLISRISQLEDEVRALRSRNSEHLGPSSPPALLPRVAAYGPTAVPITPQSTHSSRLMLAAGPSAPVGPPIPFPCPRGNRPSSSNAGSDHRSTPPNPSPSLPRPRDASVREQGLLTASSPVVPLADRASSREHASAEFSSLALLQLRRIMNKPAAQWTCPEQEKATIAMLERRQDVIAIMATSSGKSMIAILPSLIEVNMITVLILPLRSLILDFSAKLVRMKVPFELYNPARPLQGTFNLILVSADHVKTTKWRQTIAQTNAKRPVVRQIFDEAHVPPTAKDYRACLERMADLRCSFPCQIGLLSATIPPPMVQRLIKDYCMRDALVLRTCTNRPELQYEWMGATSERDLPPLVGQYLQQFVTGPQDRGLVFVPTKDIGESISKSLDCPFYKSTPDVQDQLDIYNSWVGGSTPAVVCTSAFGAGNDNPHVRVVIHAGTPFELIGFIQEVSRAGRDHQPAVCILLPTGFRTVPASLAVDDDLSRRRAMAEGLKHSDKCIRAIVTSYIDGRPVYCSESPNNLLCSRCRTRKEAASRDSSAFQASTEDAQRQRQEHLSNVHGYITDFKKQLTHFEKACAFCLVLGGPQGAHPMMLCPSLPKHDGAGAQGRFFDWKKQIKYGPKQRVCYFCHVPQGKSDALHNTFAEGGGSCEYPDVVAPAVYASLLKTEARENLAAQFGQNWERPGDALPWINQPPLEGHTSNLTALFLNLVNASLTQSTAL